MIIIILNDYKASPHLTNTSCSMQDYQAVFLDNTVAPTSTCMHLIFS